jgi:hypothetical protein
MFLSCTVVSTTTCESSLAATNFFSEARAYRDGQIPYKRRWQTGEIGFVDKDKRHFEGAAIYNQFGYDYAPFWKSKSPQDLDFS